MHKDTISFSLLSLNNVYADYKNIETWRVVWKYLSIKVLWSFLILLTPHKILIEYEYQTIYLVAKYGMKTILDVR